MYDKDNAKFAGSNKTKNIVLCITFGTFLLIFFLLCLFLPKEEYSKSERRPLTKMPELTVERVLNGEFMADFEEYATDSFPFRDSFRTVKAICALGIFNRGDNNGIYLHDGYISSVEYPMSTESIDRAAERFRYIYDKYLTDSNNVYFSLIPDKNAFMAEESGHLHLDYDLFEDTVTKKLDFAKYIKISHLLSLEDYYRTDTHWRQECITDIAEALCTSMGTTPPTQFAENTLEGDFHGVYSGQAALPLEADSIKYLTNGTLEGLKVYDHQNEKKTELYDMEKAVGNDPYEMFLSGPLSLVTVENPQNTSGRHLIMFRDSFSSSLAPLMAEGYSKITLIDIRYIQPDYVANFVDFENADVLFIYSSMVLNDSSTIK